MTAHLRHRELRHPGSDADGADGRVPRSAGRVISFPGRAQIGAGGRSIARHYDAPRRNEDSELGEDSLEELKARRAEAQSGIVDVDEADVAESLELPGADLSGEELTVRVLPMQNDEFRCSHCFLVHHRSQLAEVRKGQPICRDCA
jgi:hypothetical protein